MGKNYKLLLGNAKEALAQIEDKSIQCVITSPPYYGLRDYGTGHWVGGDPTCPHYRTSHKSDRTTTGHKGMYDFGALGAVSDGIYKHICPKCGAIRIDEQIGLEETPEEYIERLVEVFREVKRVLKDDGTLWVNIGDSYVTKICSNHNEINKRTNNDFITERNYSDEYKDKDLFGIPWMLAFALRKDGWYLRQDIIWAKPNPMPEPVKDRCVKSHEYIFLLSKKPHYKFNYESIQEESVSTDSRVPGVVRNRLFGYNSKTNLYPDAYLLSGTEPHSSDYKYVNSGETMFDNYDNSKYEDEDQESSMRCGMNKNRGNSIIYKRYNEPSQEEFVDFIKGVISAQELSDKTGIARTTVDHWYRKDDGGCLPSIEDWKIIRKFLTSSELFDTIDNKLSDITEETDEIGKNNMESGVRNKRDVWSVTTKPFKEAHFATFPEALITPCVLAGTDEGDTVLDPFNGSGTTGVVALKNYRKYIGIDLNKEYINLAEKRLDGTELEMSKERLW